MKCTRLMFRGGKERQKQANRMAAEHEAVYVRKEEEKQTDRKALLLSV